MKITPPVAAAMVVIAIIVLVISVMKSGILGSHENIPTGPPAQAMQGGGAAPSGAAPAAPPTK